MSKYLISFLLFPFVSFNELPFNVVILITLPLKVSGLGRGGGGVGVWLCIVNAYDV